MKTFSPFRQPQTGSSDALMSVAAVILVTVSVLLVVPTATSGQFLEPQSHLGRLVQSIASPLVLGQASSFRQAASEAAAAAAAGPEPISGYYPGLDQDQPDSSSSSAAAFTGGDIDPQQDSYSASRQRQQQQQHHRSHQQSQRSFAAAANQPPQRARPDSIEEQYYQRQNYYNQQQAVPLQRAPSQQVRRVPHQHQQRQQQQYRPTASAVSNYDDDGDNSLVPRNPGGDDDDGGGQQQPGSSASYRSRQPSRVMSSPSAPGRQSSLDGAEYQMGAYLGPTVDDKEINGAFNDDRDDIDDDSPANYDAPATSGGRSQRGGGGYSREASQLSGNYRQPMQLAPIMPTASAAGQLNTNSDDEDDY